MVSRTAAERRLAAEQRQWARDQGMTVAEQGRIPAAVLEAFWAAHPDQEPPGDGEGPDWTAAGEGVTSDQPDPFVEPPVEPVEPVEGAAGLPPPADLDQAREQRGGANRKRPPWAGSGARARPPKAPAPRITSEIRNDITGKVALLLALPAATWRTVDPVCGGALADNLDPIVRAAVPLICLSPELVKLFQRGSTVMLLVGLGRALQPVAEAVYHHHVKQDVMVVDGQAVPAARNPATGQPEPVWNGHGPAAPDPYPPMMDVPGHVPAPRPG